MNEGKPLVLHGSAQPLTVRIMLGKIQELQLERERVAISSCLYTIIVDVTCIQSFIF